MIHYVCGFVFSSDLQTVMLIRKNRPDWMRGMWNGIGGRVEPRETELQSIQRECLEESGLDIKPNDWVHFCQMNWADGRVDFYWSVTDELGLAQTMTDEEIGIFPVNRLPRPIVYNLRWLIPLAKDKFSQEAIIRLRPKKNPA